MSDRPLIFISAVSAEHRSLRTTVAALLDHEGYDTDFQEVLGTEHGDITGMLARHVDKCDGVIQLVGQRHGFAPPAPHPEFGECSYTQFEALYARSIGKPVRYILLGPAHPSDADPTKPDPVPATGSDPAILQAAYRQRIESDTALYHSSATFAETKNCIYELRPVLDQLRAEWRARMERQEKVAAESNQLLQQQAKEVSRLRPMHVIGLLTLAVAIGAAIYFGTRAHDVKRTTAATAGGVAKLTEDAKSKDNKLDSIERKLADIAKAKQAEGKKLSDFPREEIHAELARLAEMSPEELQSLLAEASTSKDASKRAQGLMIEQQFAEAAVLSRQAGDTKVAQRKAVQARDAVLAEEAALDYQREGFAHYYQLHYPPAIAAYEKALAQITRADHARTWAMLQNNLAIALVEDGIRTNPAEGNILLARAVAAYRSVLEVYTREALPEKWAGTQNNLANALVQQGIRSEGQAGLELLGQAVGAYRFALDVYTREALPQDWAMTQNNLANTLQEQGIRSEGQAGLALLGQAVSAYRSALEVYTREALPEDWAMTQNNLAAALRNQGERSEGQTGLDLLGQAVSAYRSALEVYTRDALPQDWAMMQNNLAIALKEQGKRSEGQAGLALLGQSVSAYRSALEVRTREALPQKWAMTQNNLGAALEAQGDKAAGEERQRFYREAEAAYLAALEVRTKEAVPYQHQMTQQSLALLRAKMTK